MLEPTADELAFYNNVTQLASDLLKISVQIVGLNNDPKMISVILYKRLCSNQQVYTLLWKRETFLESEIILRSALECAICISANKAMRAEFVDLLRGDAAYTILNQCKMHSRNGNTELAKDGMEIYETIKSSLPAGLKLASLKWEELAHKGGVPHLYSYYRMLSGFSAHVTGFSVHRGVSAVNKPDFEPMLEDDDKRIYLMMMANVMLQGAKRHAEMIEAEPQIQRAAALTEELATLSAYL